MCSLASWFPNPRKKRQSGSLRGAEGWILMVQKEFINHERDSMKPLSTPLTEGKNLSPVSG